MMLEDIEVLWENLITACNHEQVDEISAIAVELREQLQLQEAPEKLLRKLGMTEDGFATLINYISQP